MDEIAHYNRERWHALARANALFTRPYLDLDRESAQWRVDPDGYFGDLTGKDVLLLAGGGGQQSAAFALLGANVTVIDLSPEQIERDHQVAAHYGVEISAYEGDIRDLSRFADSAFDLVFQPYSLNFVPDVNSVFDGVARVLRNGGIYFLMCANPFFSGMTESSWNGEGYTVRHLYRDGTLITYTDNEWIYEPVEGVQVPPVQEYRHTLSTLINGLAGRGFSIERFGEHISDDTSAEPGTWEHFTAIAPPYIAFWSALTKV